MPSKASQVTMMANDVRAALSLVEVVREDARHPTAAKLAAANVALDDLVTLARAYCMVAFVEAVNQPREEDLPTVDEMVGIFRGTA